MIVKKFRKRKAIPNQTHCERSAMDMQKVSFRNAKA